MVIPTFKRNESLFRLLASVEKQNLIPDEVIIVFADNCEIPFSGLKNLTLWPKIKIVQSLQSVCIQRNAGISTSLNDYIFVCDDDIELSRDYLKNTVGFLEKNPEQRVATGMISEKINGEWLSEFPPKSLIGLLVRWIFFQSVWGRIDHLKPASSFGFIKNTLIGYYSRIGNRSTVAGWPLFTQISQPVTRSQFYGLGAAVFRRAFLLENKYDESLDVSGIGDNYEIALMLPKGLMINIITSETAFHHRAPQNRKSESYTYFRRVMALDYFLSKNKRKSLKTHFALMWSVIGSFFGNLLNARLLMFASTIKTIGFLLIGRNPIRNNTSHK